MVIKQAINYREKIRSDILLYRGKYRANNRIIAHSTALQTAQSSA
jgi:hypothetical protein